MTRALLAPSILSADFGRLAAQVAECQEAGADWIHVDVMDGHFVPNITMGPAVTAAVRAATRLPVDVHLMIENPERYLEAFAAAGAHRLTVHQEACPHLHRTIQQIVELGVSPGVAVNPATSLEGVREILAEIDLLLVMTVNPGFGGQAFIPSTLGKLRRARDLMEEAGAAGIHLQVDGGVDARIAPEVAEAGADVLVAGSAIFRHPGGVAGGLSALRESLARVPSGAGSEVT